MYLETRYAKSGDVHIAYQVMGDAPRDLVFVLGWVSNLEVVWENPTVARFLQRLASFSRLILFDKRRTGLSDRVAERPDLETRIDDVRAVMDAIGSDRAVLCGYSEGGAMCALFAAPNHHMQPLVCSCGRSAASRGQGNIYDDRLLRGSPRGTGILSVPR